MLPRLHPERRSILESFAASVPQQLPEQAYPSGVFLNPSTPLPTGQQRVELVDATANVEVGIANPGSRTNQPDVLCLRNAAQVACAPDADVWQVTLPPRTIAFMSAQIAASVGDRLTFLFLANDEPGRVQIASQLEWVEVAQPLATPTTFVDAPAHPRVLGGCNFATLVTDVAPARTFQRPGPQRPGATLYLLMQLCEPSGQEFVQLVPIVDRMRVVKLAGDVWQKPVRLGEVSVVEIDTAELGQAREFQVAVIPLTQPAATALKPSFFTHAVSFLP